MEYPPFSLKIHSVETLSWMFYFIIEQVVSLLVLGLLINNFTELTRMK